MTGPWGHSGAYMKLEAVVRHHLDPESSLEGYDMERNPLPVLRNVVVLASNNAAFEQRFLSGARLEGFLMRDSFVQTNSILRRRISAANELGVTALNDEEVSQLISFLEALTDPMVHELGRIVPERVPSGLPVID